MTAKQVEISLPPKRREGGCGTGIKNSSHVYGARGIYDCEAGGNFSALKAPGGWLRNWNGEKHIWKENQSVL